MVTQHIEAENVDYAIANLTIMKTGYHSLAMKDALSWYPPAKYSSNIQLNISIWQSFLIPVQLIIFSKS